ncbi:MAG: sigma-70 family RNA polymerase sigma factor [Polyangiaceae bacterium]
MSAKAPPTPNAPVDSPEVMARIHECLPLVDVLARQMRRHVGTSVQFDELVSAGREGLLGAARSFDASRGVPFRCWAALRIRGSMIDGVRKIGGIPRRVYQRLRALEAADAVQDAHVEADAGATAPEATTADRRLGSSLATMATTMAAAMLAPQAAFREGEEAVDPSLTPEESYERAELLSLVRTAIGKLPDSERTLLEKHYFGGLTLDEAAKSIGLSKSWGSRLHARAMESVTKDLARSGKSNRRP